ncbi:MAG TPA: iron-sulfur cluster repair di-iron protein [Tepidisphaeraceae bacterium]|jgi:regulator of cell morphogenesis and NO signaling
MIHTVPIDISIGELVRQRPARSRLFERLGIDYCCGGKKTLAQACAAKNLDPATIAAVLDADDASASPADTPIDANALSLSDLANHIEATHHAYLKTDLPRLSALTQKVANAHGQRDARLVRLRDIFEAFRQELESHMFKEERILFPLIRRLDTATERPPASHCGSVRSPIAVMEHEHDDAGRALAEMRELTDDFIAPATACNTYRALLDALAHLERDMHQHVHKENNVLFPRAAEKERQFA